MQDYLEGLSPTETFVQHLQLLLRIPTGSANKIYKNISN